MKTESVHPGRWEERTRDEVLVPVDDCIRWHDHERIKPRVLNRSATPCLGLEVFSF